jgi:hypothetical protein
MLYVDNMLRPARPAGYRGPGVPKWSHMLADTTAELLTAGDRLGLRRTWLQHGGTPLEHYDLTNAMRARALHELGAHPMVYGAEGGLFMLWKRARVRYATSDGDPKLLELVAEVRGRFDRTHAANCPKCQQGELPL